MVMEFFTSWKPKDAKIIALLWIFKRKSKWVDTSLLRRICYSEYGYIVM